MKKNKFDLNKISPIKYFCALSAVGIVLFFIYAFFAGTDALNWFFIENNGIWELSDHFRQVGFARDLSRVYFDNNYNACFPPLAYLYYHFIYKMNPVEADSDTWLFNGATISYEPILLIMQTIIITVAFLYFAHKMLSVKLEKSIITILLVLLSMPFFSGVLERGNILFLVVVLLMAAVYLKDSEASWKREIAMVFIAIASAFKITPAIFGLIYIKEKRYKEAFRLVVYGVIFFFLPFVFTGGVEGFKAFLEALSLQSGGSIPERWTCISGFIYHFLYMKIFGAKTITKIVQIGFLLSMVIAMFITDKKWREYYYLSNVLAFFVISNYRYTMTYLIIPCFLLLADMEANDKKKNYTNWGVITGFALVFTIPVWWFFGDIEHWTCSVCYLMCVITLIFEIIQFIMKRKNKD